MVIQLCKKKQLCYVTLLYTDKELGSVRLLVLSELERTVRYLDCFSCVVFAMLGMLSPASRGALMTAGIFLFMFMG